MFFKLAARNSRRNRRSNLLFFISLLVSIVAFYIILSLSHQDVMIFLTRMESVAVHKLLRMIPFFYGVTLFLLFFLIYFAAKLQMESRRHEFGVYLMMGMRRSRLFLMLLAEDLGSSAAALLTGIPIGILLSELVSLITAKLVGLGIIGHRFRVSPEAVLWTAAGFVLIKFSAFLILSGKLVKREVGELLAETPEGAVKQRPSAFYVMMLAAGAAFLAAAYFLAIGGDAWNRLPVMAAALLLGVSGTFLLFKGLRFIMGVLARRDRKGRRLQVFTFRQLQENVIRRASALAVSSLLILAALCCFGSGVAIAQFYSGSERHVLDYTFTGHPTMQEVEEGLAEGGLEDLFGRLFEIRVGFIRQAEDPEKAYSMDSVLELVGRQPADRERDNLLISLGYADYPYLIAQSGYNGLLEAAGLPRLALGEGETAVYMDADSLSSDRLRIMNRVLEEKPQVWIAEEAHCLTGAVQTVNLVVDSAITLSFALIVPDQVFERMTLGDESVYINAVLAPSVTEGKSLLRAVSEANTRLDGIGLPYESYLQNMGRQLFYVAAAGYITIYLAIIFLIIANTVLGVQFLTQQQKTGRRYLTLIRLGADHRTLCRSLARQVNWYFGIPIAVAALSSVFGIRSLFGGILPSGVRSGVHSMVWISMAVVLLLCVVEWIYIAAVKRIGSRFLLSLAVPRREE